MAEIGEIFRATVNYSVPASSEAQNVFHWVLETATIEDFKIFDEISRWVEFDWGDHWAQIGSDDSTIESVKVDVVDIDGTIVRAVGLAVIGLSGGEAGGVVSAAVSAYMLLKTVRPKVRGSKYIPAMSESSIDNGALNTAALAQMAFLLIEYATTLNPEGAAELVPGVPSRSLMVFQNFLDTGLIENIPAYQRRRKPNVGS